MNLRHRAGLLAAVSGIALSGVIATAPALAADAPTQAPAPASSSPTVTFMTRGTVASLDGSKLSVTSDGGQKLVTVAQNAGITLNGAVAKLSQLPIGAQVSVSGSVTNGAMVATKVEANTARPFAAAGSVTAVDGTARTVTVAPLTLGASTTTVAYPVAAKAVITLDGKPVDLAKLPVKAHILVTGTITGTAYSAQTLTAVSHWDTKLSGTVAAVDTKSGTVTVNTGSGTPVTVAVDPNTAVQLNGSKISLAQLPVGATVNLAGSQSTTGISISTIQAQANLSTKSKS